MATDDARVLKPKLTIDEQIDHLKTKGVTFERCSEPEAAAYLTDVNYYFRVTAYRTLFEKRVGGAHDGEYIGLDFADLIDLAALDQELRNVMLPMTIAIEHAAKTRIMKGVTDRADEDGYAIVADYLQSLPEDTRNRRIHEFARVRDSEYSRDVMEKYKGALPIWLFLELSSFGAFVSLYRFVALRWSDEKMLDEHYLLKKCLALRNAAAHNVPIVNGFNQRRGKIKISNLVSQAVKEARVSKRVRAAKLGNPRLQQIVTTAYLYAEMVHEEDLAPDDREGIARWIDLAEAMMRSVPHNDAIRSSFDFLIKVFDKWM